MFSRHIKLTALDANYAATQSIWIHIKLPPSSTPSPNSEQLPNADHLTQSSTSTSSPKLSWLNLVYFISAINELEIVYSNQTNSHEVTFRHRIASETKDAAAAAAADSADDELHPSDQTLAYLIVEKSKFMSAQDSIWIEPEELIDGRLVSNGNNKSNSLNLFRLNEMRNGLYSISTPASTYDLIKANYRKMTGNVSIYTLKITIR